MLEVTDPQVRTVLLHHVSQRSLQVDAAELLRAGLSSAPLKMLRRLSVHELERLACTHAVRISIVLDAQALEGALRKVTLVDEALEVQTYFVRHGASVRLMAALFKMSRNSTHRLRREFGVMHPSGQLALPHPDERSRILRSWRATKDLEPRQRYLRLHQSFSVHPIGALELVIQQADEWLNR